MLRRIFIQSLSALPFLSVMKTEPSHNEVMAKSLTVSKSLKMSIGSYSIPLEQKCAIALVNSILHKIEDKGGSLQDLSQLLYQLYDDPSMLKQRKYAIYGFVDLGEDAVADGIEWTIESKYTLHSGDVVGLAKIYVKQLLQNNLRININKESLQEEIDSIKPIDGDKIRLDPYSCRNIIIS
jgi:hypothetical protein